MVDPKRTVRAGGRSSPGRFAGIRGGDWIQRFSPVPALGAFEVSRDKTVTVFAAEGDCREEDLVSNTFAMEWPPRSGQMKNFPEVDRGAWFVEEEALCRITPGQRAIVAALFRSITASEAAPAPSRSRRKRSRIGRSDAPN